MSFESRLIAARARREKVLAERAAKSSKSGTKPAGNPSPEARRLKSKQAGRSLTQIHASAPFATLQAMIVSWSPTSFAAKAVLVFVAAVGFGIGSIFAAGMLSDSPAPLIASSAKATVPPQIAEMEMPTAIASVAAPLATPIEYGSQAVQVPDKLVAPVISLEETAPISEFSQAIFTRAVMKPLDTDALRDLPDRLALEVDKIASLAKDRQPFRVFVHAPDGIPSNELNEYVSELEASGIEVAKIGREPFYVSKTHLRFYSEGNAESARSVARSLDVEARDFSQSASSLDRIEVWVAGRPTDVSKSEPKPSNILQRVFRSFTDGSE